MIDKSEWFSFYPWLPTVWYLFSPDTLWINSDGYCFYPWLTTVWYLFTPDTLWINSDGSCFYPWLPTVWHLFALDQHPGCAIPLPWVERHLQQQPRKRHHHCGQRLDNSVDDLLKSLLQWLKKVVALVIHVL